jgi:hypothetical protein
MPDAEAVTLAGGGVPDSFSFDQMIKQMELKQTMPNNHFAHTFLNFI